jgi:hypothetical protein
MDHFYNNIQGWCDYYDFYQNLVQRLPENFNFAEIGVWKGQSLSYFVVESINSNKKGSIYAIDHWKGSPEHIDPSSRFYEPVLHNNEDGLYNLFLENIKTIKDYITVIRDNSINASENFDIDFFDCVFIDAGHEYNDVIKDLIAWYPKIKKGGIICGHDYDDPNWTGVTQAVNDFFDIQKITVSKPSYRCWMAVK